MHLFYTYQITIITIAVDSNRNIKIKFPVDFIGLLFSGIALILNTVPYGTPAYPRTFYVIGILEGGFTIFPMILAIFYGGELVWRDRDRKMHEIIDSTSLPNWAYMVMASLAWNLKAWFGLMVPNRESGLDLVKMEFRSFLGAVLLLPAQIIRAGRKIIYRILGYNRWMKDFFATWERLRRMEAS